MWINTCWCYLILATCLTMVWNLLRFSLLALWTVSLGGCFQHRAEGVCVRQGQLLSKVTGFCFSVIGEIKKYKKREASVFLGTRGKQFNFSYKIYLVGCFLQVCSLSSCCYFQLRNMFLFCLFSWSVPVQIPLFYSIKFTQDLIRIYQHSTFRIKFSEIKWNRIFFLYSERY